KGAGAVFDDAIGAVMKATMGDGTGKERFGHKKSAVKSEAWGSHASVTVQLQRGQTSTTASISTAAPNGREVTPKAARACLPLSPKMPTSRFDAPLATRCCSVNSLSEQTRTVSFRIFLTSVRGTPAEYTMCESTLRIASSAAL